MGKRRKSACNARAPFGYKIGWFAVPSTDPSNIIHAFGLRNPVRCDWAAGITAAYADKVFVSPPVGSWVLLPAWHWLGRLGWDTSSVVAPLLRAVSKQLGRVQFFATYRVDDYHLWAEARTGKIIRAFCSYQGETIWEGGRPTSTELVAGSFDNEHRPNEESVMQVAAQWSVNPCELERVPGEPGLGLLCDPPQ
jgi:hypothetical protein